MKRTVIIFLVLLFHLNLFSHPWKPSHYVIIDTDGGIDDMRAICLMLASPDIRILAITTSSGVLSAENAYIKVKSLLNSFYHEGLPVGIDRKTGYESQNFATAFQAKWGDERGIDPDPAKAVDFLQLLRETISIEKTRISFICLGGMSTVSMALKELPDLKQHVKEIIWSADGLKDTKGFNYNIDRKASLNILKEDIPVRIVKGFVEEYFYDQTILKTVSGISTPYAQKISGFFRSETASEHSYSFAGNDEMVALYIHYPQLFKTDSVNNKSENTPFKIGEIRDCFIKILKGQTVAKNQVIKEFPIDPSFYFADIEPVVADIIGKYGMDEWTSGVLANELHRHLGVFAIVGVKMGIRAKEYFCTGVDESRVTSFAGSVPPLSCMNDGLQVSTGATPGHGLLTVSSDTITRPVAEFTYLNHKIRLTLKPEVAEKISSELKEINFVYGIDSNIYWELVRKNTIKYWKDLDRHEIFYIEIIY
jgi:inosine-uridine nucleoside N-ribohydrolase